MRKQKDNPACRKVKFCVVCGIRIPELSHRYSTCGKVCSKLSKKGYRPYENCTELPKLDLTEVQRLAAAHGMSYGQYVAMREKKTD